MRRKFLYFITLIILVPAIFYAGYAAQKYRVFPIRPFVKRALIELGASDRMIEIFRGNGLPSASLSTNTIDVTSQYYDFKGSLYDLPSSHRYGAIKAYGDGILFIDGKGLAWFFEAGQFKSVSSKTLPIVDTTGSDIKDVDENIYSDFEFTVRDIEIIGDYIYASATEYVAARDCVRLALFRQNILKPVQDSLELGEWKKLFNTVPCLKWDENGASLDMIEAGGRIVRSSADHILLSVGDFGQDGIRAKSQSQDRESHYGKILQLDLATFTPTVNTLGHRNPQGLLIAEDGTILSTEHGPDGGDELNIITKGSNYGWPVVTFGTQYSEKTWPLDKSMKDHAGFTKPLYSWIPSIGVSNLVQVKNEKLPFWDGDLLVSSLFKVTLFRVKLNNRSVILIEPIYIGSRIRDLDNFGKGFALLIDLEQKLIILEQDSESSMAGNY
jgi:hypothetical protein